LKDIALLRAASALTFVHAVLHTVGGLLKSPAHGEQEIAVLNTMKSFTFDFMGSMRSYWDFYFGFGLFVALGLVLQAVLLWQLAPLARKAPHIARPLLLTLLASFVVMLLLSWRYFFVAPLATEALVAVLIAWAWLLTRPEPVSLRATDR
jgi:hypothetical protein